MRAHYTAGVLWAGVGALLFAAGAAHAAETRVFVVYVDRKPAGQFRLTYQAGADGTVHHSGTASVAVRHLLGTYRYSYDGKEVWKGDRLLRLDSTSNENGKHCALHAEAAGSALRVEVNGQPRQVRADAWPTTFWRLPSAEQRQQPLHLLDVDTGQSLRGRLAEVGPARVTVAGQPVECKHYRLTGQTQADLWYDAQGRLVHQVTIEDGHRTVLQLKEIHRTPAQH